MKFIHYLEKVTNVDIFGLLSLLIFFVFFLGMFIWVIRTKKKDYSQVSRIPLENTNGI